MSSGSDSDSRPPGRPRDPAVEDRILEVTLAHLAAHGYARMSIDRIAEESGVSKPTMYRRWSSKADLATAALTHIRTAEPEVETGEPLDDLKAALQNFRQSLLRPHGMSLVGTVLAEEEHTPELLNLFRERLVEPRRAIFRRIVAAAAARGEIARGADADLAANLLVGALYARYLAGDEITQAWCARVAETVWRGLAAVA